MQSRGDVATTDGQLTPVEIVTDIFRANVRRHGDHGHIGVHLTDQLRCRDTVHVRHDNVHEDQIEIPSTDLLALVDSVDTVFLVDRVSNLLPTQQL